MSEKRDLRQIGFVGLGAMGGAVVKRLASGPWTVKAFDLSETAVATAVTHGAVAAATAADVFKASDVVVTCLPTPEIVERFWQEHLGDLSAGAYAVDLSTIDPATSRRVCDGVEATKAAGFVACTLGKTPALAAQGEIPVFVGGKPEALAALTPVFEHMSNAVFDMNSVEGATMFKLISNLVGMTNLAVLAEGLLLSSAMGIDPKTFSAALQTTGGWSSQAVIRLDWMIDQDFAPRFAVDLAAKDLRLSVDAAARGGVATPVSAAALSVFSLAHAAGKGGLDAAAIIAALAPDRSAAEGKGEA